MNDSPPVESFVYLLVHETEHRFKIGKAMDVRARARGLRQPFDPTRSIGLRVANARTAFDLEGILKKSFRRWRIDPADIVEDHGPGSGFTEWFSLEGWDRMRQFLGENVELFEFALVDPLTSVLTPAAKNPTGRIPPPENSPKRKRYHDPIEDGEAFVACAARCGPLLLDLAAICDSCEVFPTMHAGELRGAAGAGAPVDAILSALVDVSQYKVSWGAGRVFTPYRMEKREAVTFTLGCNFYSTALGDRRYSPLQDAFLTLRPGIPGWYECAGLVLPREVFIVPRRTSREWMMPTLPI